MNDWSIACKYQIFNILSFSFWFKTKTVEAMMLRVSSGLGQKFRGSKSQHVLDPLWRNRLMARCSVKSWTWDIWQTKYILEVAHSVGLWAIWNAEEVILCPFLWVRIWAGRPSHQVWVGRGPRGEMIISFQDIPDGGSSERKTFFASVIFQISLWLCYWQMCVNKWACLG